MSRILYLPNPYSQQRQREKQRKIYPVLLAMEAEYYRKQGHQVCWDDPDGVYDKIVRVPEGLPFLDLPHPDREFTRWREYQDNGNFKYLPGTYIQSARDCWWGKCTFCSWSKRFPNYELRPVYDVIDEIAECVQMGFKEVFDDSGTFPQEWLGEFCNYMNCTGYNKKIRLSCNWRFGMEPDYVKLRKAGFRMMLYGLESANQETLDRINKGIDVGEAMQELKQASEAGIEAHLAVMFGFPWETEAEAMRTLHLVQYLLTEGYAKTAQASLYTVPREANNPDHAKYVGQIYDVWKSPRFWKHKIMDIKSMADLKYLGRQIKAGLKTWR